jgi:hypothetical protein
VTAGDGSFGDNDVTTDDVSLRKYWTILRLRWYISWIFGIPKEELGKDENEFIKLAERLIKTATS